MRTIRVCALAAFLFPFMTAGSVLAAQDEHLMITAPLYREKIRDTQHERSRSDLRTTPQSVWTAPADVVTTGSVLAVQDDQLTVNVPLYREKIRDTQHERSRSDLRVTAQPVWAAHPDKADLKTGSTNQSQ